MKKKLDELTHTNKKLTTINEELTAKPAAPAPAPAPAPEPAPEPAPAPKLKKLLKVQRKRK